MTPSTLTLKNGLTVVFVPTAQPSMTVLLLVGAGSRYENKNNNGIAHFFEHMAFKGSKKYPNTKIISETIERTGGIFNAFTSKDHTGYWIKATPAHFETIIDVLSDMIINPLLDEEEIEREKGVIIEEINMYEDSPQQKVSDFFEKTLYGNHPLGMEIAGEKETVAFFNRQTFVDYIKTLYHPQNAVLVVAGGIGDKINQSNYRVSYSSGFPPASRGVPSRSKQVVLDLKQAEFDSYLQLIEEKFSSWKNGEKQEFERIDFKQNKPKIFVHHKKTEQAHFCLGYPTFGFFDKRKYALLVLTTILGGGMSSRLFLEVRERRGLCYYVFTTHQFYHEIGNVVTQAGIVNNLDKIKEAMTVIIEEQEKIKKGEIGKDELEKAKEMVKGRLLLSLEDSFRVANFFGSKKLLEDKIETADQVIKKIDAVAVDEVATLAKQLFLPEKINFALIGPYNKENFSDLFTV
jgi:predicted Zn-dependent peptidase